jgi:hypothetical protein
MNAQKPVDFDKWLKNPYTIVLQESLKNDYTPKLTPPDGWAAAVEIAKLRSGAYRTGSAGDSMIKAILDMDAKIKELK